MRWVASGVVGLHKRCIGRFKNLRVSLFLFGVKLRELWTISVFDMLHISYLLLLEIRVALDSLVSFSVTSDVSAVSVPPSQQQLVSDCLPHSHSPTISC